MKVLVLPDIHGRKFWKKSCANIDRYDKVVFLGDYFDPYDFEEISIPECIDNFKEILDLKRNNPDKVVLLIGNHDEPYISRFYYDFSWYHCRHSMHHHDEIAELFNNNIEFFKIAHAEGDVLFTHAGVDSGWLHNVVKCHETDINKICATLNTLHNQVDGLMQLYCVSSERGGRDKYGSCIWCDVHCMMRDVGGKTPDTMRPIHKYKQVFGHTLQAYFDMDGNVAFGDALEFDNCKMLDNAQPYELDIETFEMTKAPL